MYEHAIIFIEANINTIKYFFLLFLKYTANAETEGLAKISGNILVLLKWPNVDMWIKGKG